MICKAFLLTILSALSLAPTVSTQSSGDVGCDDNTVKRIDDLVSRLTTYGNSGRKFPESAEQIPRYCK